MEEESRRRNQVRKERPASPAMRLISLVTAFNGVARKSLIGNECVPTVQRQGHFGRWFEIVNGEFQREGPPIACRLC